MESLESRAVLGLTYLVPQLLLSSNYYTEQVSGICLTWSENTSNGLQLMYVSHTVFSHSKWRLHAVAVRNTPYTSTFIRHCIRSIAGYFAYFASL